MPPNRAVKTDAPKAARGLRQTLCVDEMTVPTLGFMDDARLTKREIAQTQLVEAIGLFLTGKFIPSLTLAGAAEGILKGLVNDKGRRATAERSADAIIRIREKLKSTVMENRSVEAILGRWNTARNQAKHHGKNFNETEITINPFDEAYWMIKRALSDAKDVGVSIRNEQDFENWIVEHINT